MIGIFYKKYQVAVYDEDPTIIEKISNTLRSCVNNIIIKPYTDFHKMFLDFNIQKAKDSPFDMAVIGFNSKNMTDLILKHSNPDLSVISYSSDKMLKIDARKMAFGAFI